VVKFPRIMVLDRQAIPHTIGRRGKKRRSSHARTTLLPRPNNDITGPFKWTRTHPESPPTKRDVPTDLRIKRIGEGRRDTRNVSHFFFYVYCPCFFFSFVFDELAVYPTPIHLLFLQEIWGGCCLDDSTTKPHFFTSFCSIIDITIDEGERDTYIRKPRVLMLMKEKA
jgi:hypothetical protein